MNKENLIGKKFSLWTVLELDNERSNLEKEIYWKYKCDCGTIKPVYGYALITNNTKSCGCIRSKGLFMSQTIKTLRNYDIFFNFTENLPIVKTSNEIELSWAAGFFDGEGSTICNGSIRMSVAQVEKEPLYRFFTAVSIGAIRGPYKYSTNRQPHYQWNASGSDVIKTLEKLWPYLSSIKKQQALIKLEVYNNYLKRIKERRNAYEK